MWILGKTGQEKIIEDFKKSSEQNKEVFDDLVEVKNWRFPRT